MKPKIIALYLPQFHRIPENDEFWGNGFTDWVTVRNAKPMYQGHYQPRVPLNDNYYDLSLEENVEWQSKIAHKYGIYGFGVYHYWFNVEKNLLTKPAEIMRDDENIKTKYFFIWDNANWKRSWSNVNGNAWAPIVDNSIDYGRGPQILIPYILGKEPEWEAHYLEVLSHFRSDKYIKHNNKPLFGIICFSFEILEMCKYWEKRSLKDGFDGIEFVFQGYPEGLPPEMLHYSYEPHYSAWLNLSFGVKLKQYLFSFSQREKGYYLFDYDKIWGRLLNKVEKHPERSFVPGAFVGYDDSPRRGKKGSKIIQGQTPEKFEIYMKQLYKLLCFQKKEYLFLTAWNEWGEGAFMEPDSLNGYSYLEALKSAITDKIL